MLPVNIFVTLAYLCYGYGYVNPRYPNWLQKPNGGLPMSFPARRALRELAPRARARAGPRRLAQTHRPPERPNFDHTHFCPIPDMQQRGATLEEWSDYPWIAQVVTGYRSANTTLAPLVCTAAAIGVKVFITAARCIATAKAEFTTIIYRKHRIGVKAFIMSSAPTKQLFDDVGLIVGWAPWGDKNVTYSLVNVTKNPRTDDSYSWFEDWALGSSTTVIGFVASEHSAATQNLYKLGNMHASNRVCNKLFPMVDKSNDYWAPCVHSCEPEEHSRDSAICHRYLLGLGHAVLDRSGELVGLVTWTCGNDARDLAARGGRPLPVGIAVPNKSTFARELECAMLLSVDTLHYNEVKPGYYSDECDNMDYRRQRQ